VAIDTEAKRRSTIALIPPLPVPDSYIDSADRAHVLWLYARATVLETVDLTLVSRSAALTLWARDMGLTLLSRSAGLTLRSRE